MNKSHLFFKIKKNLIRNKNQNRCFSSSPNNKKVFIKSPISKKTTTSNKSLIGKNTKEKFIKINYKGIITYAPKRDYYKMKKIDLSKLRAHIIENKELIAQKKIYMKKENDLCSIESLDLISNLKEKEYREEINKLRKKLINKNVKTKEIYEYLKTILIMVKDIESKISTDLQNYSDITENRINFNINQLDLEYEVKLKKKSEFSDYLQEKINEIISKIDLIIKSYIKLNDKIAYFKEENKSLKKRLKKLNDINNTLIIEYKKKDFNKSIFEPNLNKKGQKILFYKKLNKKYLARGNKNQKMLNNNTFLNSYINTINNGQTYYTTNNYNLLTNKNISTNNKISFSLNYLSPTNISNINQEKTKERELNYIDKLKNKIKNLKHKINQMKTENNKPKNAFYDLIIKIFKELYQEETNNFKKIINNNKILNDSMKTLSHQNATFRKMFINKLLNDIRLYKILNSKNLGGINYFKVNLFTND